MSSTINKAVAAIRMQGAEMRGEAQSYARIGEFGMADRLDRLAAHYFYAADLLKESDVKIELVGPVDHREPVVKSSKFVTEAPEPEPLEGEALVGSLIKLTNPDKPGYEAFIGKLFFVERYYADHEYPYRTWFKGDHTSFPMGFKREEFEVVEES